MELRDQGALMTGAGSRQWRRDRTLFAREGAKVGVLSPIRRKRTVARIQQSGGGPCRLSPMWRKGIG